jgi:putative glutamine amidotransferase
MSQAGIHIGITMYPPNAENDYYLPTAYVKSIRNAGGIPILLPAGETNLAAVTDLLDGILLPGGGDIMPQLYGGSDHEAVYGIDRDRDNWEISLAKSAIARQIPLLGICRGLQVVNVAFGGSLYLHLPDQFSDRLPHRAEQPISCTQHPVIISSPSRLQQALQVSETTVTSWHHQAINRPAPDWQIVARAADGVIEAIEHKHHPWAVAVQWPELSPECEAQQSLFKAFVRAAKEVSAKKP